MLEEVLLFLICFILVLILYEIFIVFPMKNYRKNKSKGKKIKKVRNDPVEVKYLIFKYGLNIEKVDYNKLLRIVSLVSSFDIAVVVSMVAIIEKFGYVWQMILSIVIIIPLFLITYGLRCLNICKKAQAYSTKTAYFQSKKSKK